MKVKIRFKKRKTPSIISYPVSEFKKKYWFIKKRPWLARTLLTLSLIFGSLAGYEFYYLYFSHGNLFNIPGTDLNDSSGKPLDMTKLSRHEYKRASYVYAADNTTIGRYFLEIRDPANISQIPENIKQAFLAAEDKRFFKHHGFDPFAITRAVVENKIHRRTTSGASTLTQQLVRLLHDEDVTEFHNRQVSWKRKIKEIRVSIRMERLYSKGEILENFLNYIYLGHGHYGIREAGRYYFSTELAGLTIPQAALIAGLNKNPSKFCPIHHPKEALARRNWVLEQMRDASFISQVKYREYVKQELGLKISRINGQPDFSYGDRMVKEMLLISGYKDSDITHQAGLKIKTSFDPRIQAIANEELSKQLIELNREIPPGAEKIEGSFIAIDNKTGHILAMSGGHDFSETQFNRSLASRSPGSLFKPFTYATAFEYLGKTLDDTICNCLFRMADQMTNSGHVTKWWSPRNFAERNPVRMGRIPLPTGLIRSVNLATLNLAREIGIKNIISTANNMGVWGNPKMIRDSDGKILFHKPGINEISGGLVPYLPTAIGASDVNLLEMVNAFTVFARGGTYIPPSLILEIKDGYGKTLSKAPKPKEKRVLSEETSKKVTTLLRAVTKVGTAKITMKNVEQQVACKTGTSNGPRDLSLICFTPEITIGIRIGYDSSKPIELPEYMKRATGVSYLEISGSWVAGPPVRHMIDRIYKDRPKIEFPPDIEERLQEVITKYGNQ